MHIQHYPQIVHVRKLMCQDPWVGNFYLIVEYSPMLHMKHHDTGKHARSLVTDFQ